MKTVSRLKAEKMRSVGKSYEDIANTLNVSKSTVHRWTKTISWNEELAQSIHSQRQISLILGRRKQALMKKNERLCREKEIFRKAQSKPKTLSIAELFYLGLALYWAEGFKKEYSLGLSNSDPYLVKIFLQWLYKIGHLTRKQITIRVEINRDYIDCIENIQTKWSKMLDIPREQFQKPYFKSSKNHRNYDPAYFGQVRVRARGSRDFFVEILGYIEGLRQL